MQPAPQCPSQLAPPPVQLRDIKRKRHDSRLYARAIKPITDLFHTPDDHYDEWGVHRPHTTAWDAAEAEVRRRLIAYYMLERF